MEELLRSNDPLVWVGIIFGGLIALSVAINVVQTIVQQVTEGVESLIYFVFHFALLILTSPLWLPFWLIKKMRQNDIMKDKDVEPNPDFSSEHEEAPRLHDEQLERERSRRTTKETGSKKKKETTGNKKTDWALSLLGLPLNNNFEKKELNRQFRIMTMDCHPDKEGGDTELMQQLNEARTIVKKWRGW